MKRKAKVRTAKKAATRKKKRRLHPHTLLNLAKGRERRRQLLLQRQQLSALSEPTPELVALPQPDGDPATESPSAAVFGTASSEDKPAEVPAAVTEAFEAAVAQVAEEITEAGAEVPSPEPAPASEPLQVPEGEVPALPEGALLVTPKSVRFFLEKGFQSIAEDRGEHWKLDHDDLDVAQEPLALVGDKWLRAILGGDRATPYRLEIAAAVVLAGLLVPRLYEDYRQHSKKQSKAGTSTAESSASPAVASPTWLPSSPTPGNA